MKCIDFSRVYVPQWWQLPVILKCRNIWPSLNCGIFLNSWLFTMSDGWTCASIGILYLDTQCQLW